MAAEGSDIISRLMPNQAGAPTGAATQSASLSHGEQCVPISVKPAVLRAAAGEARGIAGDLKPPTDTAMRDGHQAVAALHGWQLGSLLGSRVPEWESAYQDLTRRVALTGTLIDDAAKGFAWSDEAVQASFPADMHIDPKTIGKAFE